MKRLLLLALCFWTLPVIAAIDVYEFPDAATEERFRQLTHELRCPKCQNQNINDSNAPLAHDIKDRVHSLLLQGKSNDEITGYMVSRYGEFVTYRPRFSVGTLLLWGLPALAGVTALLALLLRARVPVQAASAGLEEEEQRKVESLLNKYPDVSRGDQSP